MVSSELVAGGTTISVVIGDLTTTAVEAIVNAANSELWMGGGVAGAIKAAAGAEVETEAMAQGPIQPGESVVTSAGRLPLPIRWIVHAATMGPDLRTSEDFIRQATASALAAAANVGARSVALPALGTGVGKFPLARAADLTVAEAFKAVAAGSPLERIVFIVRSDGVRETFIAALGYPLLFSSDYTLAGHAFDTTRKAAWVADSLIDRPIPGVRLLAPEPLTAEQLAEVHDPAYVEAVRAGTPVDLAQSQGFPWDPGLWQMVRASNGGAVAAAVAALKSGTVAGSLSSGLHHAKRGRGDGFCTFNGLALAVRAAQRAGASRVLLIDLDAHCGGGTFELLGNDPGVRQMDVAVSGFDWYSPDGSWTLDMVDGPDDYLRVISRRLEEIALEGVAYDLVLYNAGMDPYEGSVVGGLDGVTAEMLAERERLVFAWCRSGGLPVAFVLAGGYAHDEAGRAQLVDLHRATLAAAASTS